MRTDTSLVGALLEGRYRVDKPLARGGMSSVYQGVDTRLDRPVAIKIMDPRFADDQSFVARFEREARSAAKLHHPNVVAVHDQGVDTAGDERRAFLVMELVSGGTLRDLLEEQGALELPLALTIIESVLRALSAAHHAGLVHRDVKPENVLIGWGGTPASGVVKVGDFGLVRAVASAGTTSSSVILGTVAYLAPEQVTTGNASARGDVYSAGILLYEMLTGTTPYQGDTALSVAYRHVNDDVPAPSEVRPGLPAELDELVVSATRRDPTARPDDADAFLHQLQHIQQTYSLSSVAIPVPPTPDIDRVSDVETTLPAMAPVTGSAGPRGTRALLRSDPPVALAEPVPQSAAEPALQSTGRSRTTWIVLGVVALLVMALVGTGTWWFAAGRYVSIPQVAEMPQAQAEQVLQDAQLGSRIVHEYDNQIAPGTAIGTQPGVGTDVLLNEPVDLVISLGRPKVPNVTVGQSADLMDQAIRSVRLEPQRDPAADKYDPRAPKGTVLGLLPAPGTTVDIGTPVLVILSKGAAPTPLPNVVGQTKEQAFAMLINAGFDPVDAGTESSKQVSAGKVTRVDPAVGTVPEAGDRQVRVWVSDSVQVPSVIGQSVNNALQMLAAAGLQGEVKGRENFGIVVGQDPDPGKLVDKGDRVRLKTFP